MEVTVNNKTEERKVVAFVNNTGALVLRNRNDVCNTVLHTNGECFSGTLNFDYYFKTCEDHVAIYEGDSITIQF